MLTSAYERVKEILTPLGFTISEYNEISYGIQFNIANFDHNGMIRIYYSLKKGLKYDFSQIKDDNFRLLLQNTLTNVSTETAVKDNILVESSENFKPLIGTDESGKGDYFGPLVTAGVYVDEKTKPILEDLGVRDSKKISDNKILILSEKIKNVCQNSFALIEISPEKYNDLYDAFTKERKNLNTLLAWAHAKAIEEILQKIDCDYALSDKFADEEYILSKLQEKGKKIKLRQEHKAEANIAVAAASVIARARFLEKLESLSKQFNINLSKGASDLVILQGKQIVARNGDHILRKIAKLHFKTTRSILSRN